MDVDMVEAVVQGHGSGTSLSELAVNASSPMDTTKGALVMSEFMNCIRGSQEMRTRQFFIRSGPFGERYGPIMGMCRGIS